MDLRDVFAANLRRLRHEKGLSQHDLAYEAEVSRSYLSLLRKPEDHREAGRGTWCRIRRAAEAPRASGIHAVRRGRRTLGSNHSSYPSTFSKKRLVSIL